MSSLELLARRGLLLANLPSSDFRPRIVLALDRRAGNAPQHRQLARMRQRVCHRALEQPLDGYAEWLVAREVFVERRERAEEAVAIGVPRLRWRVLPPLRAARHRQCPIEEITHVGEDLRRCTTS